MDFRSRGRGDWLTGSALHTMRFSLTAAHRHSSSCARVQHLLLCREAVTMTIASPESSITTSIFHDM
jgi:hypothetical protein